MKTKVYIILCLIVAFSSCKKETEVTKDESSLLTGTQKKLGVLYTSGIGIIFSRQVSQTYDPRISEGQIDDSKTYAIYNNAYDLANQSRQLDEDKNLGKIIEVMDFWLLTKIYGKIAYTQSLQGATNPMPNTLDSAEIIFPKLLSDLQNSQKELQNETSSDARKTHDIIYHGDNSKWIKLCYPLQVLLLADINTQQAADYIQAHKQDLMNLSLEDEPCIQYASDKYSQHPIYQNADVFNYGLDIAPSDSFVTLMNTFQDPRFVSLIDTIGNAYEGYPYGILSDIDRSMYAKIPADIFPSDKKQILLPFSYVAFVCAEIMRKSGNDQEAKSWYDQGISLAFQEIGASGADTYITQPGIAYDDANAQTQITQQAWIATAYYGWFGWFILRENPIYDYPLDYLPRPAITQ
jgi:hypothetical protein